MSRRTLATLGVLTITTALPIKAQVGSLDDRTTYAIVEGSGIGNQHGPLLAILLWHGTPGWSEPQDIAERRRVDSAFRRTKFQVEEAGKSIFGSWMFYGIIDRNSDSLTVEGRSLALARRDSALVIMVTIPSPGLPRAIATTFIGPHLPEELWGKSWISGDTTFNVRLPWFRWRALFLETLNRSPIIAAFLK